MKPDAAAPLRLPDRVKSLFQEYDPDVLDWEADRDLIIGRVLSAGDWKSIKWLRAQLGDANLRAWIEAREGDHLSSRQLRFWQLILDYFGRVHRVGRPHSDHQRTKSNRPGGARL